MNRTVLIATAQPLVGAAVGSVLRAGGFDVADVVTDPRAVAGRATEIEPALCLIDVDLAGGAIVCIRELARRCPGAAVVVLGSPGGADLVAYVRAGVVGVVEQTSTAAGMVRALEAVIAGGVALPRGSVGALVQELQGGRQRVGVGGRLLSLTPREADIVQLASDGLTTNEIARDLDLSPVTVRRHRGAIAAKVRGAAA